LVLLVELLGDSPWATIVVEQLHGTIAVLARFHPEYELDTLMARAMCLYLEKLAPSRTTAEIQLHRLETKVARIDKKNPFQAYGVHEYRRALMAQAKEKYADKDVLVQNHVRKKIIAKSTQTFNSNSSEFKLNYGKQARLRASITHDERMDQRAALVDALFVKRDEIASVAVERGHLSLRSAALSGDDYASLDVELASDSYSRPRVAALREVHTQAPPMMSPMLAKAIRATEVHDDALRLPDWAAAVAERRASFEDGCDLHVCADFTFGHFVLRSFPRGNLYAFDATWSRRRGGFPIVESTCVHDRLEQHIPRRPFERRFCTQH
jgi:hypothetical protein